MDSSINIKEFFTTPFFLSVRRSLFLVEVLILLYIAVQSSFSLLFCSEGLLITIIHVSTLQFSKSLSKNLFPFGLLVSLFLMLFFNQYSPITVTFVGFSVSIVFYSIFLIKPNWLQYIYVMAAIIGAFVSEVIKGTDYDIALMVLIPALGFTSLFYTAILHLQKAQIQLLNNNDELAKAKAGLHSLIENTNSNIWCVDNQYGYIKGNSKYENMLLQNFSKAVHANQNILEFTKNEEDKLFWKSVYDRGLNGESYTIEQDVLSEKQVSTFEISVNPMVEISGKVYGVTLVSKNITKKKNYEKQRLENQKFLDIILDKMPIGFELYNEDGLLIMMNERQAQCLAINNPSNYINQYNILKDTFSIINGQYDYYRKAYETGDIINYEISINFDLKENPFPYKKSTSTFGINLFSIKDEQGQIKFLIALTIDISTRKKNEELLIEQNKRFEEYSFTLSHVIRRPIANLLSLTVLLNEYEKLDADFENMIHYMNESVHELDDIIKKLNSNLNLKNNTYHET